MDTLRLIDTRLNQALEKVNGKRDGRDKERLRFDVDELTRGIMPSENFYYRVREGTRFAPLMTLEVTVRGGAYYLGVKDAPFRSEIYEATKSPPGRTRPNESFWLADELDAPLDAIEKYMLEELV
jgi:hypothetical protein